MKECLTINEVEPHSYLGSADGAGAVSAIDVVGVAGVGVAGVAGAGAVGVVGAAGAVEVDAAATCKHYTYQCLQPAH